MAKINLKNKKTICKSNLKSNKGATFLVKAKLALYLQKGISIRDAAKLCKVGDYQLGVLRSDPEFEDFIECCSLNCEHNHLKNIDDAGKLGQWQASAWFLERKFPEKYGKKDTIRHEYEIKLLSFQKIMLGVINELEPNVRQQIMQKLRTVNVTSEVNDIHTGETKFLEAFSNDNNGG